MVPCPQDASSFIQSAPAQEEAKPSFFAPLNSKGTGLSDKRDTQNKRGLPETEGSGPKRIPLHP